MGFPRSARVIASFLVMAAAFAACNLSRPDGPVEIKTGSEGGPCALAGVGGVLAADDVSGLGFRTQNGITTVVFPYGYSARREGGVVVLVDPSGLVIAREGDRVSGAGAFGDNVVFLQCQLQVIPSTAPST